MLLAKKVYYNLHCMIHLPLKSMFYDQHHHKKGKKCRKKRKGKKIGRKRRPCDVERKTKKRP